MTGNDSIWYGSSRWRWQYQQIIISHISINSNLSVMCPCMQCSCPLIINTITLLITNKNWIWKDGRHWTVPRRSLFSSRRPRKRKGWKSLTHQKHRQKPYVKRNYQNHNSFIGKLANDSSHYRPFYLLNCCFGLLPSQIFLYRISYFSESGIAEWGLVLTSYAIFFTYSLHTFQSGRTVCVCVSAFVRDLCLW